MAANSSSPRNLMAVMLPFLLAIGRSIDVGLLLFFLTVGNRETILGFTNQYINPATVINLAEAATILFTVFQIVRNLRGFKAPSSPSDDFVAKPMIFPCRTSHTRLVPKTHSFSYSYLWVGIPVGWKGNVGGLLSADAPKMSSPWYRRVLSLNSGDAWHTVDGDDYLGRGHADGGLHEKLHSYLQDQVRGYFSWRLCV